MTTILIVEADEPWRELFRDEFEREGFKVLTAANGMECLRLVEEASPDIVITEARLPGMDGLDLMARILDRHPRMHIVLHSACASYLDNFLSWAADACLTKRPDTHELRQTVRRLIAPEPPAGLSALGNGTATVPRASRSTPS